LRTPPCTTRKQKRGAARKGERARGEMGERGKFQVREAEGGGGGGRNSSKKHRTSVYCCERTELNG